MFPMYTYILVCVKWTARLYVHSWCLHFYIAECIPLRSESYDNLNSYYWVLKILSLIVVVMVLVWLYFMKLLSQHSQLLIFNNYNINRTLTAYVEQWKFLHTYCFLLHFGQIHIDTNIYNHDIFIKQRSKENYFNFLDLTLFRRNRVYTIRLTYYLNIISKNQLALLSKL